MANGRTRSSRRATWLKHVRELLLVAACTAVFVGVMVPACAEARRATERAQTREAARGAIAVADQAGLVRP